MAVGTSPFCNYKPPSSQPTRQQQQPYNHPDVITTTSNPAQHLGTPANDQAIAKACTSCYPPKDFSPSPAPGASVVTAPKAPGPAPVAEQAQREPPHKKPLKSCPSPKVRRSQRVLNQRQHGLGSLMLPKGYLGIQKLAIGGVSKTKHSGH
ncbi:hypothetical protein PCASD_06217 [Puccinia coronata f. sp. avenae]|uniref:Uncharacterized protein n=1 Tax=Puccinia coronata f. sp. avenae TaxID=200324 RepID=A0A2N5TGR8_9BASI|nr:hypothetical protein PCASD_06217 [Puccinia coronata f. sp. avenae]